MSKPAWLDVRSIVAGLAIAAASVALGGAVDVRDRVAKCEAADAQASAVGAERQTAILQRLERIERKLDAVAGGP